MEIVTGVDGTQPALEGARTAARLAERLGATLHVVSAFGRMDVQKVRAENLEFVIAHEDDARSVSAQAAETLAAEFPALDVLGGAEPGKPADALVAVAGRLSADLIVVGNKRSQGFARVLGSIASDVVGKAACDVYIAHTHSRR
jgi:nucleotide-binding universal stress UspA family protein